MSQRRIKSGPIPVPTVPRSLSIELKAEEQKLFGLLHAGLACADALDAGKFLQQVVTQTIVAISQRHGMPNGAFVAALSQDGKTLEVQERK